MARIVEVQDAEELEEIEDVEWELVDFTRTATWQRVISPSLKKRLQNIERKLAIGLTLELDKIRELQIAHKFISSMIENPIKFFSTRTND